jgi:hypothetical protein
MSSQRAKWQYNQDVVVGIHHNEQQKKARISRSSKGKSPEKNLSRIPMPLFAGFARRRRWGRFFRPALPDCSDFGGCFASALSPALILCAPLVAPFVLIRISFWSGLVFTFSSGSLLVLLLTLWRALPSLGLLFQFVRHRQSCGCTWCHLLCYSNNSFAGPTSRDSFRNITASSNRSRRAPVKYGRSA